MSRGCHYNMNHSKSDIELVLAEIQACIREDRYVIALNRNRQENREFIDSYNLTAKRQKEILLLIEVEDFCHSLRNTKIGYEHEKLYVFCPQVVLHDVENQEEPVDIYVKFNIMSTVNDGHVVVISFHERNKPIDYLFTDRLEPSKRRLNYE